MMKKGIGLILCAALLLLCGAALAEIRIDDANFPDRNFQAYVRENLDTDKNGVLSEGEIAAVTYIDISGRHIKTMKGLEFFSALTGLDCSVNDLTELDLSGNPNLQGLDCGYNQLTELDVSTLPGLEEFACNYNHLTSLDVSQNTALKELFCESNELTELDVSHNTELRGPLVCENNKLTTLDVSKNTQLELLYCSENELTNLELGRNPMLRVVDCGGNNLKNLDVRNCEKLNELVQKVQPHSYTSGYGWSEEVLDEYGFTQYRWIDCDRDMHVTIGNPDKPQHIASAYCMVLDEITFEQVTEALSGTVLRLYLNYDAVPDEGKYFTGVFVVLPDHLVVEPEYYISRFEMPDHNITIIASQADLMDAVIDLTGTEEVKADLWLLSLLSMKSQEGLAGADGGYSFYLDLNGDGKADVGCSYQSDEEDMGVMKRLPGADALTENYTLTFEDAGDNTAPYRSAELRFVP